MRRPLNIQLVLTDQHRPDLISRAGDTPNIDRIAARGAAHTTGAIDNRNRFCPCYDPTVNPFAPA